MPLRLLGLVDRDLEGLTILLEPGEFQWPNSPSERDQLARIRRGLPKRHIQGVEDAQE